jgi:flagellar biosynthetic protein FliP
MGKQAAPSRRLFGSHHIDWSQSGVTSPRVGGEVDRRTRSAEGDSQRVKIAEAALHPDPLPACGERERTEQAAKARHLPAAHRLLRCTLVAGLTTIAASGAALAQDISVTFGQGGGLTERVIQLIALITVLSLAPSILVMVTSFTRIVVVLSLLRTALGTATAPPNSVIISLALFLTVFVMAPVFQGAYDAGIRPLVAGEIDTEQAFQRGSEPFHAFMRKNVREKDLQLFLDLSRQPRPDKAEDLPLRILVPAFMISELKRAFEIGFLLFLPFLIIDLVVASVLMSMGMMMLPPVVVSLPFKLIFFVLVDGWNLVAGSLVQSYGT